MSAARLIELARAKGAMIATAESCTGGLVAGAITDIPGSSDVFDRGFVTYSNAAKSELLDVDPELIATRGAVSPQVAEAMARGALAHAKATVAASVTGVAGPGGTEAKPEGMVCFALAIAGGETHSVTHQFGAIGRARVRAISVETTINMLITALH